MEFLLPVALKLFPNMLPSTFEDKYAAVRSLINAILFMFSILFVRKRSNVNYYEFAWTWRNSFRRHSENLV